MTHDAQQPRDRIESEWTQTASIRIERYPPLERKQGAAELVDPAGPGSISWFTLPFMPSTRPLGDPAVESTRRTALLHHPRRNYRFLLAEDNAVNQVVARRQLEKMGYRAESVANGHQVLDALLQTDYALVLIDCQLPVLDGYETTRRIRQRENGGKSIPVIAVTAHATNGDREKCLEAGMNDTIAKPFRKQDLADVLVRWLPS